MKKLTLNALSVAYAMAALNVNGMDTVSQDPYTPSQQKMWETIVGKREELRKQESLKAEEKENLRKAEEERLRQIGEFEEMRREFEEMRKELARKEEEHGRTMMEKEKELKSAKEELKRKEEEMKETFKNAEKLVELDAELRKNGGCLVGGNYVGNAAKKTVAVSAANYYYYHVVVLTTWEALNDKCNWAKNLYLYDGGLVSAFCSSHESYPNIKKLAIFGCKSFSPSPRIAVVFPNLEELSFYNCSFADTSLIPHVVLGLQHLKELWLPGSLSGATPTNEKTMPSKNIFFMLFIPVT
ncbi:MAG: hypothetical protein LBS23_02855 [Holosporaceae bacterium]|jgi:hypothetical protein|nr:hypothetical protein [Holosporaceae bacterium]